MMNCEPNVEVDWLHLWRFDEAQLLRYADGSWQALELEGA
jgi:hypothetical protein